MNDNDNIKITVPKDGTYPTIEGTKAVGIEVAHEFDQDHLAVTLTATGVGDDALHAGSLTVTAVLHRPEVVPNSGKPLDEQAALGAEYARTMIDAMQAILTQHFTDFFAEAAKAASDKVDEKRALREALAGLDLKVTDGTIDGVSVEVSQFFTETVEVIKRLAIVLLMQHGGDKVAAKDAAETLDLPDDVLTTLGNTPFGVSDYSETRTAVIELVRHAIDLADVSGA